MAENLDDGEFWLPPQFLTDDDSPKSNNNNNLKAKNDDVFHSTLRSLFPYRLSSPVESLVGSSETESSDEEEHMAELTRRMTHQLDLNCSKVQQNGTHYSTHSLFESSFLFLVLKFVFRFL